MHSRNIFDGFWIRLIAIFTMTIDHLAIALSQYALLSTNSLVYIIMRIFGRLSLPLFAFGIVEGIIHTHSHKKYLGRLGICALAISLALFLGTQYLGINEITGNIFIDLFLGGVTIYCLSLPKQKKLLCLVPIALSILLIFNFIPNYLQPQYHLYGVALIIIFYGAYCLASALAPYFAAKFAYEDVESFKSTIIFRNLNNILVVGSLLIINVVFYFISKYNYYLDSWLNMSVQVYSIFAGAFLLFYTGKRGYNSKWFQYFCYLYYPIHILGVFGITYLIAVS